jgi:hypothetical protein
MDLIDSIIVEYHYMASLYQEMFWTIITKKNWKKSQRKSPHEVMYSLSRHIRPVVE